VPAWLQGVTSIPDRALLHLAARQGGVVGRSQALAAGLSTSGVSRRLDSREWVRVQPRAYRMTCLPLDRSGPMWAAVLSSPASTAVAAGRSAAWWHRLLDEPPAMPEIIVPRSCAPRLRAVTVTRTELDSLDRVVRRGLPVVSAEMAVLQSIAVLPAGGAALLDRAIQGGLRHTALSAAAVRWRRHRGARAVNALLRAAADGAASEAERIAHRLLRSAAIRGWSPNRRVGRAVVDIAFADDRLAVEIDGWAWHHDRERFERDRSRQNALVLAGWTVLRFTWGDLTEDPGRVVTVIRAALGR
jgi:very-short-patch-repair endonuclease